LISHSTSTTALLIVALADKLYACVHISLYQFEVEAGLMKEFVAM